MDFALPRDRHILAARISAALGFFFFRMFGKIAKSMVSVQEPLRRKHAFCKLFFIFAMGGIFLLSGWAHRKFGATWRMCCNLQYMRASRSTKCCNLQYVVVFEISRSFLPIRLFSQRILNFKNLIEKLQMRNRVCFLLLCVVCGLPMQSHKSDTRDEKRLMGRNDFLI